MSAFNEQDLIEIQKLCERYPHKEAALLPVLWLAQQKHKTLTDDILCDVAKVLDLSIARVQSVVSFYTLYKTKPVGLSHIQICRNISCVLKGAKEIIDLAKSLNIPSHANNKDTKITYELVECLGACSGAPVLQVNSQKYHENVNSKSFKRLIEELS